MGTPSYMDALRKHSKAAQPQRKVGSQRLLERAILLAAHSGVFVSPAAELGEARGRRKSG